MNACLHASALHSRALSVVPVVLQCGMRVSHPCCLIMASRFSIAWRGGPVMPVMACKGLRTGLC